MRVTTTYPHGKPCPARLSLALLALLIAVITTDARAQEDAYGVVYRPAGVSYQQVSTPHFAIIYEDGLAAEAAEAARILEASLAGTKALVGVRHRIAMPVVLNRFNDRSNGFVTPLPFKQEIEGIGIKGNTLSPRYRSWLQTVVPHELTHAVHADFGSGVGLIGLVGLFAPDVARSLNLFVPPGLTEGIAVYRESQIEPGAGRLNHPLFTMQFRAAMATDPWRLSELLEEPAYTRPFDRFYNGGGHWYAFMHDRYGAAFFQRAARWHYVFPFAGFGAELWYATGKPPWAAGRAFRRAARAEVEADLQARQPFTPVTVLAGEPGAVHRRPRWVATGQVVVHRTSYHEAPGFYRIDVATEAAPSMRRVAEASITEDRFFSVEAGRLLYARYVPDTWSLIQAQADLMQADLATGQKQRLTRSARLLGPVAAPGGGLWALENDGQFNHWVHVGVSGRVERLTEYARSLFKSLAVSPDGRHVAAVLNVRGVQGLWIAETDDIAGTLRPLVIFREASVYDADWAPDGEAIVFSADLGGVSNVYSLDRSEDVVRRVTNVPFGALEPAVSPDGRTLAFINYQHERFNLVAMPWQAEAGTAVDPAHRMALERHVWTAWLQEDPFEELPPVDVSEARPYRAHRHLAPRMVYPVLETETDDEVLDWTRDVGLGLGVQGVDPLETVAYRAEAFWQSERLWGRAQVSTGRYKLRPEVTVFREPERVNVRLPTGEVARVGREREGAEVGVRLPIVAKADARQTTFVAALRGGYYRERFFDVPAIGTTAYETRWTLRPQVAAAVGLRANVRDLMPRRGLLYRANALMDVDRTGLASRHALLHRAFIYMPLLHKTTIALDLGLLSQNQASIFNLDRFVPRGMEDTLLGRGTHGRVGLFVQHPLAFIDQGLVILPIYVKALYSYGFAEHLRTLTSPATHVAQTVAGGGLGLEVRLFYFVDLDLRLGAAYRIDDGSWTLVGR